VVLDHAGQPSCMWPRVTARAQALTQRNTVASDWSSCCNMVQPCYSCRTAIYSILDPKKGISRPFKSPCVPLLAPLSIPRWSRRSQPLPHMLPFGFCVRSSSRVASTNRRRNIIYSFRSHRAHRKRQSVTLCN
jgi:hypothetical protein